jgi:hypothetical protein
MDLCVLLLLATTATDPTICANDCRTPDHPWYFEDADYSVYASNGICEDGYSFVTHGGVTYHWYGFIEGPPAGAETTQCEIGRDCEDCGPRMHVPPSPVSPVPPDPPPHPPLLPPQPPRPPWPSWPPAWPHTPHTPPAPPFDESLALCVLNRQLYHGFTAEEARVNCTRTPRRSAELLVFLLDN